MTTAAVRVDAVRCAVSWSADVFTVARGDCAELASCDFAAPHRNGGCGLRGRWPVTHQKDKSRGASSITAFDSWFDIDLLIYNWQNASISLENQQLIKIILAETVRFELTDGCPSAVFKTAGLNHSPKSPDSLVF